MVSEVVVHFTLDPKPEVLHPECDCTPEKTRLERWEMGRLDCQGHLHRQVIMAGPQGSATRQEEREVLRNLCTPSFADGKGLTWECGKA